MMLTGLHTTYSQGFYKAERDYSLKVAEANSLRLGTSTRELKPHADGKLPNESVAIGYGYDLLDLGKTVQQIKNDLNAASVTLTQHDETWLIDYRNGSTIITKAFLVQQAKANAFTTDLGSEPVAAALLTDVLDDKYEVIVTNRLAQFGLVLSDSRERAALVSLAYANPSLLGSKLMQAIVTGNRADAWFEIRYQSNAEPPSTAGGTATRRFYESELFGLYGEGTTALNIGDSDAKSVFRMYTQHRDAINAYESRFGQGGTSGDRVLEASSRYGLQVGYWPQESNIARTFLITTYAEGRTIDGEVLMGQDVVTPGDRLTGTVQNDLIFGEKGHDILKGEAGDDVLLGGDGTDQLTGGTGNDYLDGGAGYDTYVYRINDGQDTIRDADGKGSLFYDGQLVVGGIRREGDPENLYRSMDGTFTFVQSGTDLIVNNLITMKNYTPGSGVLGITLRDLSSLTSGTPPVIDYPDNGLATEVITIPATNGPYILERTDAFNYVVISSDLYSDTIDTGIGNDQLYGNGSNDRLYSGEGDDQLFGGVGHDLLEGGAGEDLLKGGPGNDVLRGGADNDSVQGDSGNDIVLGEGGDDVDGGDGADWVFGMSRVK